MIMTGLIVITLILSFTLIGPGLINDGDDDGSDTDGDGLLNVGEIELSPEYDSLDDVRVNYEVAGSVLTSWFFEDGQYNIVAYHGPVPDIDSCVIVASDTITISSSPVPTTIVQDYDTIPAGDPGIYGPGHGALGFMVTNNNRQTTVLVWVWEA